MWLAIAQQPRPPIQQFLPGLPCTNLLQVVGLCDIAKGAAGATAGNPPPESCDVRVRLQQSCVNSRWEASTANNSKTSIDHEVMGYELKSLWQDIALGHNHTIDF